MFSIILCLFMVFVPCAPTAPTTQSTYHYIHGTIGVSNSSEYHYIHTSDGNGWAIDATTYLLEGDSVIVIYDDMGTEDVFDDEVIHVSKIR